MNEGRSRGRLWWKSEERVPAKHAKLPKRGAIFTADDADPAERDGWEGRRSPGRPGNEGQRMERGRMYERGGVAADEFPWGPPSGITTRRRGALPRQARLTIKVVEGFHPQGKLCRELRRQLCR